MKRSRGLMLLLLTLAGCGPSDQTDPPKAIAHGNTQDVALSAEAQTLLDGGGKLEDIIAARAFVAPFIRTNQSQCFGMANLRGADMTAAKRSDNAPVRHHTMPLEGGIHPITSIRAIGRYGGETLPRSCRDASTADGRATPLV